MCFISASFLGYSKEYVSMLGPVLSLVLLPEAAEALDWVNKDFRERKPQLIDKQLYIYYTRVLREVQQLIV